MKNVDKTIDALCNWVQKELKNTDSTPDYSELPEMVKALAQLVSARAINGLKEVIRCNTQNP